MAEILIIDDDLHIRLLIKHILETKDHKCEQAATFDEAWKLLKDGRFQLALCDVGIPGGSSLELLKTLRDMTIDTAVVMVNIIDEPDVAQKALEYGADGYLNKPFEANELLIQVENALRRRALEIENRNHRNRLENLVAERTAALEASEKRYRVLVESMTEGLAIIDLQGQITFSNPQLCKMLRRPVEQLTGKPVTGFITPEDLGKFQYNFELGKTGRPERYELTWHRPDGIQILTRVSTRGLYDDAGRLIAVLAVITNITDLKFAEERSRLQAELLENVREAVVAVDLEGQITYWGRGAEALFGRRCLDALGRQLPLLLPDLDGEPLQKILDQTVREGSWKGEYIRTFHNSKTIWMDTTLSAVQDKDRRSIGVIGIFQDVSPRKLARDELSKRQKEISEKAEALTEMNTALKVLLAQREKDRKELEENILSNVEELLKPYLKQLKLAVPKGKAGSLLDILEMNIDNLISPFSKKLSRDFYKLTTNEIKVAQMVKDGITNKEIASSMNVSIKTVEYYRAAIRGKMGLRNKKVNLKSYLRSLA